MKKVVLAIMFALTMSTAHADVDVDLERSLNKVCNGDVSCKGMIKSTMAGFLAILLNRQTRNEYFEGIEQKTTDLQDMECTDIRNEAVFKVPDNMMSDAIAYAAHYMVRCQALMEETIKEFESEKAQGLSEGEG